MKGRSIIVTDADMDRLSRLARALKLSLFRDQLQLELLEQTLESAEITSSERIPRDVIRMNSRIRVLDFDTRKIELYTLVFPENANISTGWMSVLAPMWVGLWVGVSGVTSGNSLKRNGGDDETRTRDLCRDRAAF